VIPQPSNPASKSEAEGSPDQAIRLACEKAGLPFFTVTDSFRSHEDAHFFFELDGHFDASGHQFYVDQLTPIMGQFVKAHMAGSL
jgi:hypothetical protein